MFSVPYLLPTSLASDMIPGKLSYTRYELCSFQDSSKPVQPIQSTLIEFNLIHLYTFKFHEYLITDTWLASLTRSIKIGGTRRWKPFIYLPTYLKVDFIGALAAVSHNAANFEKLLLHMLGQLDPTGRCLKWDIYLIYLNPMLMFVCRNLARALSNT